MSKQKRDITRIGPQGLIGEPGSDMYLAGKHLHRLINPSGIDGHVQLVITAAVTAAAFNQMSDGELACEVTSIANQVLTSKGLPPIDAIASRIQPDLPSHYDYLDPRGMVTVMIPYMVQALYRMNCDPIRLLTAINKWAIRDSGQPFFLSTE